MAEKPSRRGFLKASGAAAAGVVVGGAAGGAVGGSIGHQLGAADTFADFTAYDPEQKAGFEHLVVFMGENRSFDNLLGYLYDADSLPEGQSFDGLNFGDYSCPSPLGGRVPVHPYTGTTDEIMGSPDPDPGEEYPHVNTQLFNTILPASNADLFIDDMAAPFNAPARGVKPTMDGFVSDYVVNWAKVKKGGQPASDEVARIMGSFTPEMLPVLSTLARNFAVYDSWHAAVPSQTFCNRSFFHASTSHGFVTNKDHGGYDKWLSAPPVQTIFNRLEDAGVSWRVYFDAMQLVSFTGVLHAPVLEKYWRSEHFATMERFYEDVEKGRLPAYSFIEPRLTYNHNDFHPPFGVFREGEVDGEPVLDSAVSDVRAGEALVHQIYTAIKQSATPGGSNALNTMLLITFDEHGGTYDHVPPPSAVPPDSSGGGEMDFTFDRLGCRVPAIAVSAWTAAGTVINDDMHHGAVIATLSRLHGLRPLSRRDAGANDLFNAINLGTPRHPKSWPTTTPQFIPPNPEANAPHPGDAHRTKPLSPPARGLLGLLLAKYGRPDDTEPENFGDAYNLLNTYGVGLFGKPQ
ncbi:alkaline phosphatase family protein [Rathayibacter sp. YIM 133350]|uniref:alkaline phosphatase family protein n=1 Tax=Rathayibacter sp. YIM 133350 TaxID=3131992 RepID=UPI00307F7959